MNFKISDFKANSKKANCHKLLTPSGSHPIFSGYENLQITIPELMKTVKIESTNFIDGKKRMSGEIFMAGKVWYFSYAKSRKDNVVYYILTRKASFKEEL